MKLLIRLWDFVKSPGVMAILAIAGFAFGIYATYFYEKRPALAFEIISNASVYDVRENLSKLDISYAGQNLRAENKTLRLISLRILNSGQTTISKGDYDESEPLGFFVKNGKILEIPKFFGSNDYLNRNIKPILSSESAVKIEPIIIDVGEYIEAQALVLTSEGTIPSIEPLGKIAGIKHIQILEPYQSKDQRSLWSRISTADSIWIQIVRAPVYGLFAILLLMGLGVFVAIILIPIESISSVKKKHTRETHIKKYAQGRPLMIADQFILEKYKNEGEEGLRRLHKFIDRTSSRNNLISNIEDRVDETMLKEILRSTYPIRQQPLTELENQKLVTQDGIKLLVEPDLARALKEFADLSKISLKETTEEEIKGPTSERILEIIESR